MAEKKKKDPTTPRVPAIDAETFVKTWQKAKSAGEARELLGAGASGRAQRMRKAGVKLKEFPAGRKPLDVKGLNALIK